MAVLPAPEPLHTYRQCPERPKEEVTFGQGLEWHEDQVSLREAQRTLNSRES